MASFEEAIETACANKEVAGAVCMAGDISGNLQYSKVFGTASLKTSAPLALDSTFWIASCTKLLTSVAALQCVKKGLITLDEDVGRVVPEIKDLKILRGFDKETEAPILEANTKPITLKLLLTHSAGMGYGTMHPLLKKWTAITQAQNPNQPKKAINYINLPLIYEPGAGWSYSVALDWTGLIVERLNSTTLGEYFQKNIFDPVGVSDADITFHPEQNSDFMSRLVDHTHRNSPLDPRLGLPLEPDAPIIPTPRVWPIPCNEDYGGAGLWGSAPGYMKIIGSLCRDDGLILDSKSLNLLFTPHLGAIPRAFLNGIMKDPGLNSMMGPVPAGVKVDWGLGGILFQDDTPQPGPRAGTMMWSGLPCVWWWMDRSAGIYGIYASQLTPTGDPKSIALNLKFRAAMYEKLDKARI